MNKDYRIYVTIVSYCPDRHKHITPRIFLYLVIQTDGSVLHSKLRTGNVSAIFTAVLCPLSAQREAYSGCGYRRRP